MPNVRLFALSHIPERFTRVPNDPLFQNVNLRELKLDIANHEPMAESRVFLADLFDTPDFAALDYVGFVNARWDEKYPANIPLANIAELFDQLAPDVALSGFVAEPDWFNYSLHVHPRIGPILTDLANFSGLSPITGRRSIWANDFICHVDVFRRFLKYWRLAFGYLFGKYGLNPPFDIPPRPPNKPRLKPAYLYERITTLWFSNQKIRIVPAKRT